MSGRTPGDETGGVVGRDAHGAAPSTWVTSEGLALRRGQAGDHDRLLALQRAAYAVNRVILRLEPLPLVADYHKVLRENEVWLLDEGGALQAALVLEVRPDDLLIESVAVNPHVQGRRLGHALLAAAVSRAGELGRTRLRLYTGTVLRQRIAWYERSGFVIERLEIVSGRSVTDMVRDLG